MYLECKVMLLLLNSKQGVSRHSARWPPCICLEDDSDNDTEQSEHTSKDHHNEHADKSSRHLSV